MQSQTAIEPMLFQCEPIIRLEWPSIHSADITWCNAIYIVMEWRISYIVYTQGLSCREKVHCPHVDVVGDRTLRMSVGEGREFFSSGKYRETQGVLFGGGKFCHYRKSERHAE